MNSDLHFWIEQKKKSFENLCKNSEIMVLNSRTMREVKQNSHVAIPYELNAFRYDIPGHKRLKTHSERKMEEILKEHLNLIEEAKTEEEAQEIFSEDISNDWQYLRGDYARLYLNAQTMAFEIINSLKNKQS
jgi:DNA-binding ferritin-like protein (Dps family)